MQKMGRKTASVDLSHPVTSWMGFEPDTGSQGGVVVEQRKSPILFHRLSPVSQSRGYRVNFELSKNTCALLRCFLLTVAEHRLDVSVVRVIGGDEAARLLAEKLDELVGLADHLAEHRVL